MDATLVATSSPMLDNLVLWNQQAIGVNPASKADSLKLKGVEKYQSCLQEIGADPTKHLFFSVQFIGDERDILEALSVCGMPFVAKDTIRRGITYCFVSGRLDDWSDAVIAGCAKESTREIFTKIMGQFESVGINPWKNMEKKFINGLVRLEHKR